MKTIALAVAALGLAATASPAFAGGYDVQSVKVSTAGLDLATPEGQEMLDRRIARAAKEVCQLDEAPVGTRIRSAASRECYVKARASAERQMASLIEDQRRGG